ncbi:phytoene/squalene synthase family protein [Parafilimonas sp.]|uniref:phytoene/squalene synthase family protein n=1 Tax=Parafilimonas sp. TaxID=1969739 RepID=UPI0039E4E85A
MIDLFHKTSQQCSRITAENYSTSFAAAIRLLHKHIRPHIYNIYGFVRFADEIVDTFHNYNKESLLNNFRNETYKAINEKISLNPILHSFQLTINQYHIDISLINAFFNSMQCDLDKKCHTETSYKAYIYGSAESVGLMCLHIFCHDKENLYEALKEYAKSLGAAFQKVNFLRDIKADNEQLNRMYFPGCCFKNFTGPCKKQIEQDIQKDFDHAYQGILLLPAEVRLGVYIAYRYYLSLFKKIKRLPPKAICKKRIRLSNHIKFFMLARAGLQYRLHNLGFNAI